MKFRSPAASGVGFEVAEPITLTVIDAAMPPQRHDGSASYWGGAGGAGGAAAPRQNGAYKKRVTPPESPSFLGVCYQN